jgi:hypothetical protein
MIQATALQGYCHRRISWPNSRMEFSPQPSSSGSFRRSVAAAQEFIRDTSGSLREAS